jgi:hypothetical protein
MILTIDRVLLLLAPRTDDPEDTPDAAPAEAKAALADAAEAAEEQKNAGAQMGPGLVDKLVQRLVAKLQVSVTNVHVRVQGGPEADALAGGIYLRELRVECLRALLQVATSAGESAGEAERRAHAVKIVTAQLLPLPRFASLIGGFAEAQLRRLVGASTAAHPTASCVGDGMDVSSDGELAEDSWAIKSHQEGEENEDILTAHVQLYLAVVAKEPARLPEATPRTSSRLRRVASSISIRWPGRQAASESIRAIALGSFSSR